MRAEIITIGDELLIGQVIDTNSAWLGIKLSELGIQLYQRTACGDNREHILQALAEAESRSQLILMTGGLGPTKDDITKKTVCEYFETDMVLDKNVLEWVSRIFRMRKMELLESNRQQAMLPANATVLWNKSGTAPGMWFERNGKIIISLPGVPYEMKTIFEEEIVPKLKATFRLPAIYHRTLQTAAIGESYLAEKIKDIEERLPAHIRLAYLPSVGMVRLRLSAYGSDLSTLEKDVNRIAEDFYDRIGEHIFGEAEDTLQKVLGDLLRSRNKTLATAESCTGGYVAHLITQVAGSSDYFMGSVIGYANHIKEQELGVSRQILETDGAVSEACVRQMALGVLQKYNVDYSMATSGIAGPGGGTVDKPVGTVWMAVASNTKVLATKLNFGDNRERTIQRTAITVMNMLRKMLLEET